ncbi:hypothetical protein SPHINGOAX6_71057 [Sphingomonas sp. AX6]|nr:hypothetical protein SPHINGOAX6_71057 [Sphingomonas sp. AX6]
MPLWRVVETTGSGMARSGASPCADGLSWWANAGGASNNADAAINPDNVIDFSLWTMPVLKRMAAGASAVGRNLPTNGGQTLLTIIIN